MQPLRSGTADRARSSTVESLSTRGCRASCRLTTCHATTAIIYAICHATLAAAWATGDTVHQVVARWAPVVQPLWVIQAAIMLGYVVKDDVVAITEYTEKQYTYHRPCEFCKERVADGEETVLTCTVCAQNYHKHCLPRRNTARGMPQRLGDKYTCEQCRRQRFTTETLPRELRLFVVQWEESTEPRNIVMNTATPAAIELVEMERQQRQQTATAEDANAAAAQGAKWPIGQRRGPTHEQGTAGGQPCPPPSRPKHKMYDITIGQHCRKQLVIHPHPINPLTDIAPTGNFEVMIRPVMSYSRDEDQHTHVTVEKACIYQPSGHCTHMLPIDRAAQLYQRYTYMMKTHPHVLAKLGAGTLAQELSKLMNRYAEGTTCGGKGPHAYMIESKHQRVVPETLQVMLHDVIGCTKERFSSPLHVAPCSGAY
jgi:hypothetical protein